MNPFERIDQLTKEKHSMEIAALKLADDYDALKSELARVQADNSRYVECIIKSESVAERINLVGELEALNDRNEELLGIVMRCLGFWEAPNPTFGCGAKRQAELAKIKSDARAAIARKQGGAQ